MYSDRHDLMTYVSDLFCYMQEDQFQRLLPTFIQVIDLTEQEEAEYWNVVSAIFEGKQITSVPFDYSNLQSSESPSVTSGESSINNKVS